MAADYVETEMEELTQDESFALLDSLDVAHVATIADGEPYVTPISYVVRDNTILFRTGPGRRLDAMKSHPRVCVEASRFDEGGYWESVIVYGNAEVVGDPNVEGEVVAALLAKYGAATESLRPPPTSALFAEQPIVVAVSIDSITGRCSGRGLTPPSRPGRL